MRLLVLTELFLPTKGGTAVWFSAVYPRLGGKELHIVTAEVPGSHDVDSVHVNSIHRLNLRRRSWVRPESLLMYLAFIAKSLSLVLFQRFQAIHAGRALPEGFVAWMVSVLTRLPVIIYAHGEELTTWGAGAKYRVMRFVLRHADRVIANSDYTAKELRHMGVNATKVTVINPGVDVSRFQPGLPHQDLRQSLHLGPDANLMLSVGRLQKRKGFDMVIRSLPRLLERAINVHVAIIGIGEERETLGALAAQLGVTSRVHFLGHVLPVDLPRWYNACDLFVMPNRNIDGDTEGFGMVFLEAAACGRCAIAGRDGGTGDAVEHGKTGYRVDGSELSEIVEAMATLLGDRRLRDDLARSALDRVQKKFTWDAVAAQTAALHNLM